MKSNIWTKYRSPYILAQLPKDTPVLLALSGGADSSALLYLLCEDSKKVGFRLHAAHFHHGIRGEEADRDALFCKNLAEKLNIPFHSGRADIPSLAKQSGNSIEAEARDQRYAFLDSVMRENGIKILVTAHHAEDNVESIMLHILRGSGIAGLCGIEECRPFTDGTYIVRPILRAEKQDVLDYCNQSKIEFVTDSTNADTGYLRNNVRVNVTPAMRAIQPNLTEAFIRLSQSASEANELIEKSACEFISSRAYPISLKEINALNRAVKARVISKLYSSFALASLERVHIDSIAELCSKGVPHSAISLPGKISAKIESGGLILLKDGNKISEEPIYIAFSEGEFLFNNKIKLVIKKNPNKEDIRSELYLDIEQGLIGSDAHFRSKKDGDVILAGKHHKRVKKLLNEKQVPLSLRSKLPLLVSNEEILWIPTVASCDAVKSGIINDGDGFYRISIIFEDN